MNRQKTIIMIVVYSVLFISGISGALVAFLSPLPEDSDISYDIKDNDGIITLPELDPDDLASNAAGTDALINKHSINILAMGTDNSNSLTDTMIMVNIDKDKQQVTMCSIPRDTQVRYGKNNGKHKINSCYPAGYAANRSKEDAINLTLRIVKEITGIPIHYYAVINTKGFRDLINALDGVEFNVPRDMKYDDPVQNLHVDLKKGLQKLNGAQAEGLVRWRKDNSGGGYRDGDLGRIRLQQDFIKALIEQKLNSKYILKVPAIFSTLATNLYTSFTLSDIDEMATILGALKSDNVVALEIPGYYDYENGVSYFFYKADETLTLFKENFSTEEN